MTEGAEPEDPYGDLHTVEDSPLSRTRRLVAARLGAIAAASVPVTLMRTVTLSTSRPYDDLIAAVVRALSLNPRLNAIFEEDRFRSFVEVNLGIAVEGPQGLVVPVLRDAGSLDRDSLTAARRELGTRVKERRLSMSDLVGGTFSVSNLGPFEIEYFTPVLNPPQVAILGVGRAVQLDDSSTELPLSLTFDHRVNDGVAASELLTSIQQELTAGDPERRVTT